MLHEKYYAELEKYKALLGRKNAGGCVQGTIDRWKDPFLRGTYSADLAIRLEPERTHSYGAPRCECRHELRSDEIDNKFYLVARWKGMTASHFRRAEVRTASTDSGSGITVVLPIHARRDKRQRHAPYQTRGRLYLRNLLLRKQGYVVTDLSRPATAALSGR
jgi:hypothetical protein